MRVAEARPLVWSCLFGILISFTHWLLHRAKKTSGRQLWKEALDKKIVLAIVYLASSCFAVTQPGTFFPHYFLFLLHPLVLLATASLGVLANSSSNGKVASPSNPLALVICSAILLVSVVGSWLSSRSAEMQTQMQLTIRSKHSVSVRLTELANPETKLVVWGWLPRLFVESQLPQATSESVTFRQIAKSGLQDYFLSRFVQELTEHDDVVFVDACETGGSYWFTSLHDRHWNFPSVKEVIHDRFQLLETIDGVMIYQTRQPIPPR
jgi:hypothetical protein